MRRKIDKLTGSNRFFKNQSTDNKKVIPLFLSFQENSLAVEALDTLLVTRLVTSTQQLKHVKKAFWPKPGVFYLLIIRYIIHMYSKSYRHCMSLTLINDH